MFFIESQIVFGVINMVATLFLLLSFMFMLRSLYALIFALKASDSGVQRQIFEKLFLGQHLSEDGKETRKIGLKYFLLAVICFIATVLMIFLFTHGGWK